MFENLISNLVRTMRFWNNLHQVRSTIGKLLEARKEKAINRLAKQGVIPEDA